MEDGTAHNKDVLYKRFRAFERLLYFLVVLLLAALITYLKAVLPFKTWV